MVKHNCTVVQLAVANKVTRFRVGASTVVRRGRVQFGTMGQRMFVCLRNYDEWVRSGGAFSGGHIVITLHTPRGGHIVISLCTRGVWRVMTI